MRYWIPTNQDGEKPRFFPPSRTKKGRLVALAAVLILVLIGLLILLGTHP